MAKTKKTARVVTKRITAARMRIVAKPDKTSGKSNKKGRKPSERSQENEIDTNEPEADMSSNEQDEEQSEIEMADSGQEESQDDGDTSLQSSEEEESAAAIALSIEEDLVDKFKTTIMNVVTEEEFLDNDDCEKAVSIFRELVYLGNYDLRKAMAEAITCLLIEYENRDNELGSANKKLMDMLHDLIKAFEMNKLWVTVNNSGRVRREYLELVREVLFKFQCVPTLDGDEVDFYITTIQGESDNYEFKSLYHMIIRNCFNEHDYSIKTSGKIFTRIIELVVIVQFLVTGGNVNDSEKEKNAQGLIAFLTGGPCELFVDKMIHKATNMAIVRLCWIGDVLNRSSGGCLADSSKNQLRGVVLIASDEEEVVHVMSPSKGRNVLTFNKTNAEIWNTIAREIVDALQWPAYKVFSLMSAEAAKTFALELEEAMKNERWASEKMKADGAKYRNNITGGVANLAGTGDTMNVNLLTGGGEKVQMNSRQGGVDKGKEKTDTLMIITASKEQLVQRHGCESTRSRSSTEGEFEGERSMEKGGRVELKYTNMDECSLDERIFMLEANMDQLTKGRRHGKYDKFPGVASQISELATELTELRSRANRELSVRSSMIVTTNAYKNFSVRPRLNINSPFPFSWESEMREKLNAVQVFDNIKLPLQQDEFNRFGVTNILDNIEPFMLTALGGRDTLSALNSIEKVLKVVKDYFNKSQKLNSETFMDLLDMRLFSNENPTVSFLWKLTQRVNHLVDAKVEIPFKIVIFRLIKHIEYPLSTYFNSRWAVALAENKDAVGDIETFKKTLTSAYEDSLNRAGTSNSNKGGGQRNESRTKYGGDQPGGSGGSKRPRGGSEKKLPKDQVLCWNKPCHAKDCEWMHTKAIHPERFPSNK